MADITKKVTGLFVKDSEGNKVNLDFSELVGGGNAPKEIHLDQNSDSIETALDKIIEDGSYVLVDEYGSLIPDGANMAYLDVKRTTHGFSNIFPYQYVYQTLRVGDNNDIYVRSLYLEVYGETTIVGSSSDLEKLPKLSDIPSGSAGPKVLYQVDPVTVVDEGSYIIIDPTADTDLVPEGNRIFYLEVKRFSHDFSVESYPYEWVMQILYTEPGYIYKRMISFLKLDDVTEPSNVGEWEMIGGGASTPNVDTNTIYSQGTHIINVRRQNIDELLTAGRYYFSVTDVVNGTLPSPKQSSFLDVVHISGYGAYQMLYTVDEVFYRRYSNGEYLPWIKLNNFNKPQDVPDYYDGDLDSLTQHGEYFLEVMSFNKPTGVRSAILDVKRYGELVYQILYDFTDTNSDVGIYVRRNIDSQPMLYAEEPDLGLGGDWTNWKKIQLIDA